MYYIYMIECNDKTIYTGITTDTERRLKEHKLGVGAKYTRGRGPFEILKVWKTELKSEAAKAEYFIKKQPKHKKIEFSRKQRYFIELFYEKKGIKIMNI